MMKNRYSNIIIFLFFVSVVFFNGCSFDYQSPVNVISEINTVSTDRGYFGYLRQKNDGGFLITGRISIDTVWQEYATMINATKNGTIIWQKDFVFDSCSMDLRYAIQRPDGKILFSGFMYGLENGKSRQYVFMALLDGSGNLIKRSKILICKEEDGRAGGLFNEISFSGGLGRLIFDYLVYNPDYQYPQSDTLHIINFNDSLEILSDRKYSKVVCSGRVNYPDDGGLLIPGSSYYGYQNESQLFRFDDLGHIIFHKTLTTDEAFSAIIAFNGNYLISSLRYNSPEPSVLYEIDKNGEIINSLTFADSLNVYYNSVHRLNDNGYLFANADALTVHMTKLDKNLKTEWISGFGDQSFHLGLGIELVPLREGGFAILEYINYRLSIIKTINFN